MSITEQVITRIYRDVVKREPDAGGLNYWTAYLDGGGSCEILFHLLYAERVSTPAPPPSTCSGSNDLSDTAQHGYQFTEGEAQTFCFRSPGGVADLTVFPPAGTTAKTGHWSVNGGPEQSFTPSGSDFRFKPIDGPVSAGVQTVRVRITGIIGAGRFSLQATGAVGP